MLNIGVKEDEFESFIVEVYNKCKLLDIHPDKVAEYIKEILQFSTNISISKIPTYIENKCKEKEVLEDEIEKLNEYKRMTKMEIDNLNKIHSDVKTRNNVIDSQINWLNKLRDELSNKGIPVDDIYKFANLIENIKSEGYDFSKVLEEYANITSTRGLFRAIKKDMELLKVKHQDLKNECSDLQEQIDSHSQTITIYNDLEDMGLGLKQLKGLKYTIEEIAEANDMPRKEAVERFLKDIEDQYDNKLGFQSKIEEAKTLVNTLKKDYQRISSALTVNPLIGPSLINLYKQGIKDDHIIKISRFIDKYQNSDEALPILSDSIDILDKSKSAIEELTHRADDLKKEIELLKKIKSDHTRDIMEKMNSKKESEEEDDNDDMDDDIFHRLEQ